MDGMAFIKTNKKITKMLNDKNDEIEDFKHKKIEEFEEYFEKFEDEKDLYLVKVKDAQKQRVQHKKEMQKKAMKDELRNEILKEIEEENKVKKLEKVKTKYSKMYPNYDKEIDYNNLDTLFMNAIGMADDLSKDELENLKKMKEQAEKAFMTLAKVSNYMEKFKNKKVEEDE
jgi:type I site-specific restriction-modification system R (restriction) subunit